MSVFVTPEGRSPVFRRHLAVQKHQTRTSNKHCILLFITYIQSVAHCVQGEPKCYWQNFRATYRTTKLRCIQLQQMLMLQRVEVTSTICVRRR